MGLLALGGFVLGSAESLQEQFLDFIADYVPGSADFVTDNVETVVRYSTPLGIASVVGLFWMASAVFGAITRAVNRAWGVRRDRPFYLSKARQMTMALSLGCFSWPPWL